MSYIFGQAIVMLTLSKSKSFNAEYIFLALFYIYLFLLPLPLGSNQVWSWSISHIYIFSLLLCYGFLFWPKIKGSLHDFKFTIIVFTCIVFWLVVQLLPIPISFLQLISPHSADAYLAIGNKVGSISLDSKATLSALLKLINYISVFVIGLNLLCSPKRIKACLLFIVISGTYNGFYGAFEMLSGQDTSLIFGTENGHRASGTFTYHNHFANFLMLCLSAGLGYFIASLTNITYNSKLDYVKSWLFAILDTKTIVRLGLTIMVIALVMSHSRMGNTAFFVSLMVVSFLYILIGQKVPKGFKLLIVSMLIIDVFVVSAWFGLDKVKERLEGTSIENETRDEVILDGLEVVKDYPLTGSGAGSFRAVFSSYQSENVRLTYNRAHNDYLQFAIEYGVPSLLLLGVLIAHIIKRCIYVLHKVPDKYIVGGAAACLMAIVGMLIHMSVDFPLLSHANSVYFLLLISIGYCSSRYLPDNVTSN